MAKETHTDEPKGQEEVPAETHSSGPDNDPLNTREQRLEADPALAPELAVERQEEAAAESEKEAKADKGSKAKKSSK
jgi:hypothetical protein